VGGSQGGKKGLGHLCLRFLGEVVYKSWGRVVQEDSSSVQRLRGKGIERPYHAKGQYRGKGREIDWHPKRSPFDFTVVRRLKKTLRERNAKKKEHVSKKNRPRRKRVWLGGGGAKHLNRSVG